MGDQMKILIYFGIYMFVGVVVAITYGIDIINANYWWPYAVTGYCAYTSCAYFMGKDIYYLRGKLIKGEDPLTDFSRAAGGYLAIPTAGICIAAWLKINFGIVLF